MRLPLAVALFALVLAPSVSSATLLTFDDITVGVDLITIPDGYGGFDWSAMGVLNSTFYGATGYRGGTVSGEFVAFNEYAEVAMVRAGSFDFNSAYLAAAWNNGLSVTVRGFVNNVETYSRTVNNLNYSQTPGATATLVQFDFLGIDRLSFESFGGFDANESDNGSGAHFVLDNFSFSNQAPIIPEPATLGLLGLGLMSMTLRRRARR